MLFKRLIDIVASALGLLLLAPLLLLVAVAIYLGSGRPILYSQDRVGRAFRRFRIWKFRSMRPHPEGSPITISGDKRVTRIGRLLRATKLDELPQLWNVLRGDMSLVGPRPELPEYVDLYRERYEKILTVRPGITDLASVLFRSEEDTLASSPDPLADYVNRVLPAKLELAEEYVRMQSLLLDFSILGRTMLAVLRSA